MAEQHPDKVCDGEVAIVIGAGSAIAAALLAELAQSKRFAEIISISRGQSVMATIDSKASLHHLISDYSEDSIKEICLQLASRKGKVSRVFICNGILHDEKLQPEKRLEDLCADNLHMVFQANAALPMLWLKHLKLVLSGDTPCTVVVFSARIGSIDDNHRGGWYAYRASKAALNMLVKTASIELTRLNKNLRFVMFHPGTTDTPLSKPFQRAVSKDKLFTPAFVATQLLTLVNDSSRQRDDNDSSRQRDDDGIEFMAWDGNRIAW